MSEQPLQPAEVGELMSSGRPWAMIVPITKISNYYDAIEKYLLAHTESRDEFHNTITRQLRGICPQCYHWSPSATLAMPSMSHLMGRGSAYGGIGRLLSGLCPTRHCSSESILLLWRQDPDMHGRMQAVHEQIGAGRRTLLTDCLSGESETFGLDALYAMRRKSEATHELTGQRFSGVQKPDLFVWASVVPGLSDAVALRTRWFPDGYLAFFNDLCAKSNWDFGDVAVVHWLLAERGRMSLVFVSFSIHKDRLLARGSEPGSLVLPQELLNDEERSGFN